MSEPTFEYGYSEDPNTVCVYCDATNGMYCLTARAAKVCQDYMRRKAHMKQVFFAIAGAVVFPLVVAVIIGTVFGVIALTSWLGAPVVVAAFAPATLFALAVGAMWGWQAGKKKSV